ncbi:hypothetical protein BH10ACT10_BH10ACT10_02770 [soil metagenome]
MDPAERARRFEAVIHAAPDFISIATLDGQVEFVNGPGRALVGLDDATDLSTLKMVDFLTADGQAESARHEMPAVLRGGQWSGFATLRDWRDGSESPVAVTSFMVRDVVTDEPIALASIQQDLRPSLGQQLAVTQAQSALAESERRHQAFLLHMSDILMVVTATGGLQYASPSAARVLGYPDDWFVDTDLLELVHPDDREATRHALTEMVSLRTEGPVGLRLRSADGTFRHFEALANNLIDDPAVGGILFVVRDVTDRNKTERAERTQAQVLELIAGEAPVPTVLRALALSVEDQLEDTVCTVLLAEGSTEGLVFRHGASPSMPNGYAQALEGRSIPRDPSPCGLAVRSRTPVLVADIIADDRFAPMRPLATSFDVRSCWSYPVLSATSGELLGTFALYTREPGLPDDRTSAIVARASRMVAITLDRQVLLGRLAHQAHQDELTGLPNRLALLDRLSERLRAATEGGEPGPGVVFLDLDRLKIVNDSLGHDVGDELLVRIAGRVADAVPEGATVARFGGDEFVILVDRLEGPEDAGLLVERVLAAVGEPVLLAGRSFTPSASAGVVIATPGQSATEVLRDADIAMYRAKHGGGSRYALFTDDMRRRAFDRLELEEQVRHGLAAGEFRVFYQPVVDLTDDDALVGFEALLRWQHPTRGLLGPASFIDLAEETGLIVELGEWVLGEVATTAGRWREMFPGFRGTVAVNLAARQLGSPRLLPAVRRAMAQMAPWSLGLELTESTLMQDTVSTRGLVDDLVSEGASLAIDDFGTGFSSLSYLTRLPVSTLKIDRSFVLDLDNPGARAVAATVLGLADALDLTVVAEGIETSEQRETLLGLGCRFGQGFLMGRPMPERDALAFLRASAGSVRRTG